MSILSKILSKLSTEKCTECGKTFERLEWGGRLHTTRRGTWFVHPIDYVVTLNCETFEESREAIAKLEKMDRLVRKIKEKHGDKFCSNHYKGCPQ